MSTFFRLVAVALASLSLAACVQTVAVEAPFDPAAAEFAIKPGPATISGQGFMRRNDGVVVYAAGSPVYLTPQTPYTMEAYLRTISAPFGVKITNPDARLKKYTRQTQANGEGRFTFTGIPDGAYIVVTSVMWMAGDMRQGGDLMQLVTVKDGQNQDVILTR